MSVKKLAVTLASIAFVSTSAMAADSADKKKPAANKTATTAPTNKAADKGAQGGIILQNNQKTATTQTNKAADKGAQGGIILQNNQKTTTAQKNKAADKGSQGGIILQNNQKTSDKGAQGGIILQNNAGKSINTKAPASKTATPGG